VKEWEKYDYFVLTYKANGPDPVIASIPLDESKLDKLVRKSEKLNRELQLGGNYTSTLLVLVFLLGSFGGVFYSTMKVRVRAFLKRYTICPRKTEKPVNTC
jgi:hypothetical protein